MREKNLLMTYLLIDCWIPVTIIEDNQKKKQQQSQQKKQPNNNKINNITRRIFINSELKLHYRVCSRQIDSQTSRSGT